MRPKAAANPRATKRFKSPLDWPETNVFVFGVLLNLPWELLQAPLFRGMAELPHLEGARLCLAAAVGDATLLLLAYWITALVAKSRGWFATLQWRELTIFTGVALALAMVIERLSTGVLHRWSYGAAMVVAPWLGIGLSPILQWLVLPAVVVFFVHRQLSGLTVRAERNLERGRP